MVCRSAAWNCCAIKPLMQAGGTKAIQAPALPGGGNELESVAISFIQLFLPSVAPSSLSILIPWLRQTAARSL